MWEATVRAAALMLLLAFALMAATCDAAADAPVTPDLAPTTVTAEAPPAHRTRDTGGHAHAYT